jgi:methyl-accepting chemotaxis protein
VSQNAAATSMAGSQNTAVHPHLSSRTEAQAASLEETMVRIEKLIATVRQNSVSAKRASLLAVRTSSAQEEVLRAA